MSTQESFGRMSEAPPCLLHLCEGIFLKSLNKFNIEVFSDTRFYVVNDFIFPLFSTIFFLFLNFLLKMLSYY